MLCKTNRSPGVGVGNSSRDSGLVYQGIWISGPCSRQSIDRRGAREGTRLGHDHIVMLLSDLGLPSHEISERCYVRSIGDIGQITGKKVPEVGCRIDCLSRKVVSKRFGGAACESCDRPLALLPCIAAPGETKIERNLQRGPQYLCYP